MTFDQYIGMEHHEAGARITIQSHHCNPTGNINGGVIISLADNISTGAANTRLSARKPANANLWLASIYTR